MPNRADRRASGAKYPTSLDAWAHDAVIKGIELPKVGDGPERLVDFEVPNLSHFAKRGDLPNPLQAMAIRAEWDESLDLSTFDTESLMSYYDLMCWAIAWGLRKPDVITLTGSLEAAAEWVDVNIRTKQKAVIWQRAMHIFDPEDVVKLEQALARLSKEVKGSDVGSVTDLAPFRDGDRRPVVPNNGAGAGEGS